MTTADDAMTVVVPAHDAAAVIGTQLAALDDQSFDGQLAVIVVDNNSTDDTAGAVRRYAAKNITVTVVDANEKRGAGYARNCGFALAETDVVLGCDADDVVSADWARLLADALEDADLVAGGLADWDGSQDPSQAGPPYLLRGAGMGYLATSSGATFGCRRATWGAVGGFDEDLVTCEDIDFGWRVQQAGFRFAQCPDAVIAYRVPQDTRALLRKWFSYGYFQVRLYEKHRDHGMARRRPLRALARLGLLLLTSYHALSRNDERRRRWCMQVGRRLGSIKGSIDERVLFL